MNLAEAVYQLNVWDKAQADYRERIEAVDKQVTEIGRLKVRMDLPPIECYRIGVQLDKRQWVCVGGSKSVWDKDSRRNTLQGAVEAAVPRIVKHLEELRGSAERAEKMLAAYQGR